MLQLINTESILNFRYVRTMTCVDFISDFGERRSQYPTQIARWLCKLEQVHGHAKIWNTLLSMGLPEPILHVMQGYLQYGQRFKVEGSDF